MEAVEGKLHVKGIEAIRTISDRSKESFSASNREWIEELGVINVVLRTFCLSVVGRVVFPVDLLLLVIIFDIQMLLLMSFIFAAKTICELKLICCAIFNGLSHYMTKI